VQMGGALAERIATWTKRSPAQRRALLMAGLAAGFAGAIGAPLAGAVFGVEVLARGRWRLAAVPGATLAAYAAVGITRALHAPHGTYVGLPVDLTVAALWPMTLVAGFAFGLTARTYLVLVDGIERLFARVPGSPIWRPALGGAILTAVFLGAGAGRYSGLGLDVIETSLHSATSFMDPLAKLTLTALTIGAGFRGGEFIPLVFVGTTLGAALGGTFAPAVPLATLGFGTVFAAAANTPLAGAVMAAELFGWKVFPPALIAGSIAFAVSGHPGLYDAQPAPRGKRWG